jgi:hypothetical protein
VDAAYVTGGVGVRDEVQVVTSAGGAAEGVGRPLGVESGAAVGAPFEADVPAACQDGCEAEDVLGAGVVDVHGEGRGIGGVAREPLGIGARVGGNEAGVDQGDDVDRDGEGGRDVVGIGVDNRFSHAGRGECGE